VLGIDASETMITEAQRRASATTLPVEFRLGDVCHLDIDDSSYDGVLCERVLQHVVEPSAAMAELVRITRPGGRIVVIDTDWGLHAIHGADPDLTRAVVESWARERANGLVGRQLPAIFAAAGMPEPTVRAEVITSTDPQRPWSPPFTTMAASAARAGAIRAAEAEMWLSQLVGAGRRGHFFWALTMFAVASIRPLTL
jgi:SAM-dependent methyltransferase